MVLQPCIAFKCAVMIYTLQTVDFMQVFQSVIIFWSPLAAAALVLYLKTVAHSCATDMIRGVVLKKEVRNIIATRSHHTPDLGQSRILTPNIAQCVAIAFRILVLSVRFIVPSVVQCYLLVHGLNILSIAWPMMRVHCGFVFNIA